MRRSAALAWALAVALVGASMVVASPAVAAATHSTRVDMDAFPSGPVIYKTSVSIDGQVVYVADDGSQHAVEGTVVLKRRYLGTTTWRTLGTDQMSGFLPAFNFTVAATRNAQYKVSYAGNATYGPSSSSVVIKVARKVSATGKEPRPNVFFLSGRVTPSYAKKSVALMRKKCRSCAWKTYARQATSATSRYRFRLPVPSRGTHYFRVKVPPSVSYITSYSGTWTITRIL
ncbi:MAG TPA: hypothetical protein VFH38_10430 [Jatrophihabitans sp.]|nr:hypothetical protein [Jatrophihabitans sp.]